MEIEKEVQTKSETFGLRYYITLQAAMKAAEQDRTIWKISFDYHGEHVRLVRANVHQWIVEPFT